MFSVLFLTIVIYFCSFPPHFSYGNAMLNALNSSNILAISNQKILLDGDSAALCLTEKNCYSIYSNFNDEKYYCVRNKCIKYSITDAECPEGFVNLFKNYKKILYKRLCFPLYPGLYVEKTDFLNSNVCKNGLFDMKALTSRRPEQVCTCSGKNNGLVTFMGDPAPRCIFEHTYNSLYFEVNVF